MRAVPIFVAALALSGCTQVQQQLTVDLTAANANLASAVTAGLLSPNDPAPGCLTSITAQLENPWTPQVVGPISAGSIAYVAAQQAIGGLPIPEACVTLVGKITLDGLHLAVGSVIGGVVPPIPLAPK
jgi:hypothetical protein